MLMAALEKAKARSGFIVVIYSIDILLIATIQNISYCTAFRS